MAHYLLLRLMEMVSEQYTSTDFFDLLLLRPVIAFSS